MRRGALLLLILAIATLTLDLTVISVFRYPSRRARPPSDGDTSFWLAVMEEIRDASTLNVTIVRRGITECNGSVILEEELFYTSEVFGGRPVRINAIFMRPANATRVPVVVFQHGYCGTWRDFYDFFKELVARMRVGVFAIDAPGCSGRSSPYPSSSPESLMNTSLGPDGSFFYHVAYTLMRGITYLTTRNDTDSSAIIVSGASMGGVMSFIVGAVDDRVRAVAPIVAAGNYLDSAMHPRLLHFMVPPHMTFESAEVRRFLAWFDVYHYAEILDKPVLYMVATHDEYFSLTAANDTFNAIASEDKVLVIWPNGNHFGTPWAEKALDVICAWLRHILYGEEYPRVKKISVQVSSFSVEIRAELSEGASNAVLFVRGGRPLSDWCRVEGRRVGDSVIFRLSPLVESQVAFYVAVVLDDDIILACSPIFVVRVVPLLQVMLLITCLVALLLMLRGVSLRPDLVSALAAVIAFVAPLVPAIDIAGRAQFSLWDLMETYKVTLGLPWFITHVYIIACAGIVTLTLLKRRVSIAVACYAPHLILTFFAMSLAPACVRPALALILALLVALLLAILPRVVRKHIKQKSTWSSAEWPPAPHSCSPHSQRC